MNCAAVTERILAAESIKEAWVGKEWTTAACLGQMPLEARQAKTIGKRSGLDEDDTVMSGRFSSCVTY